MKLPEVSKKRGRPKLYNDLIQYQLRIEPEILQQMQLRMGRGMVSQFVRDAIKRALAEDK